MPSIRDVQLKIHSVKNIKKITEAMEAVAANKMRRNQIVALQARPYAQKALEILAQLSQAQLLSMHPLLKKRQVKNVLIIPFTADKGLCGAFNANVLRKFESKLNSWKNSDAKVDVFAIGKKARQYCNSHNHTLIGYLEGVGDMEHTDKIHNTSNMLIESFIEKKYDEVHIIYTNFISTLTQRTVSRQLLPFSKKTLRKIISEIEPEKGKYAKDSEDLEVNSKKISYLFEPTEKIVLDSLLPELIKIQVLHALLETNASEHSARMIAMKNATDNAGELIHDLQLTFNKARQAGITAEISEIVGGAEALKN